MNPRNQDNETLAASLPTFDPLLTESEAAEILRLKPATLATWRSRGKGPKFVRVEGSVRYPADLLEQYLRDLRKAS